jgi:hypothetical protein
MPAGVSVISRIDMIGRGIRYFYRIAGVFIIFFGQPKSMLLNDVDCDTTCFPFAFL